MSQHGKEWSLLGREINMRLSRRSIKRETFKEKIRHSQMWVWDSQETVNLKVF